MKSIGLVMLLGSILGIASCSKNSDNPSIPETKTETLPNSIITDRTLETGTNYLIDGQLYVKNNAVLTIPAGTTISFVKHDEPSSKGTMVITQGAKLVVNGTSNNPVVFTSAEVNKAPGDWGAVIILGKAPVNIGTGNVEGLAVSADTKYGGSISDDNSGTIKYLRLEYCGGINPDAEEEWAIDKASGLSLHSVGSATTIDYVMVAHSRDDGFQFVGGTVNATHLVAYNNGDDDFDFDYGFTGKMQYIISYRTELASEHALRANGLESYNDAVPTANAPLTRPIISNMTIIGPQGSETTKTSLNQGVYIRKGTRFVFQNSIIAEYPQGGLMTCPRTRPPLLNNKGSEFKHNLVQSDNADRAFSYDTGSDPAGFTGIIADPGTRDFALNNVNQNGLIEVSGDLKLANMYGANGPDLTLQASSPAMTGANFDGPNFTGFFTVVTYRGAVGTTNWASPSNWAVWK
ncbi:hypothetical protein [Solitalea canadensis]|uniref:T9SS C-terminal target domain-containing protein n=1 Tax=Solitalea canadensis (strain ATCC 29591 / DSM 3403 / JCM 21819 / LMG 8368 / NBRC 15130 / NCIMB 12057 / USAM 9D) TaxID=929556 RepID=H8KQG8_SOLCM|nr:hypothetical protein [Solitalea canadensis]AFD06584.1 hypothetical protein Solca_1509 [Solitalea canadensis DSM 3403]